MKEIEKTKENLKLNQLDESQRKKLYQKFVDAGGQVQTERQVRRNLMIDRDKQRTHQQRLNEHYSRVKQTDNTKQKPSGTSSVRKKTTAQQTGQVPFADFRIRMKLRLRGVTGFNTHFYKNKFLSNMSLKYKPALMEIQNIYLGLFKQDTKRGNQLIMRLDKISPVYYELIEKTGELYDPIELRDLSDNFLNFPDVPRHLNELQAPFVSLFRSIYIIKSYENTIYSAFEKAIDIYQHLDEERKAPVFRKKDVRNALYIIFYMLYPRLHALYCRFNSVLFDDPDKRLDEYLNILPSEKPGNRIRYDLSNKQKDNQDNIEEQTPEEEPVSESKSPEIDPCVTEGLRIMYRLDFKDLRKTYDKKGVYGILSDNDKVLLTYLLYLEFEKEYSFVLTTNRIKYKSNYLGSGLVDYKIHMQELFNTMRKIEQSFTSYHESFINFNKIKEQKPLSNDQYITYSKRVDELSKKKEIAGSEARMVIKNFMEQTSGELEILCRDMDEKQMYIDNPQDVIEMNPEIEGNKKLHGFKVYEALRMVRNYAAAFAYRLGTDGDLYGKQEYSDKENISSEKKQESDKEQKKSGSILDELDDIM